MKKIINYFTELLKTLRSIDGSLKQIARCVREDDPHGKKRKHIVTGHWNDTHSRY